MNEAIEPGAVERCLQRGSENAVSIGALLNILGIKNARMLHSLIAAEREQGALILSSSTGGYFLPSAGEKGKREINEFIHTLRSRSLNTLRILRSARRALAAVDGQISLNES